MQVLKLLIPLFLFIIGGVYGIFSQDYIETHKPFYNWAIIPAFAIGIYYAFGLTYKHDRNKNGGIAFGRIIITVIVTMLSFRSFQGYLIYYNCNIGKQSKINLKGQVSELNFPKPKNFFDKNSIVISLNSTKEKLKLDIPSSEYQLGEAFEKEMISGSLGIIYSPN